MNEIGATPQEKTLLVLGMAIALIVVYLAWFGMLYFVTRMLSRMFSKRLAEKGKI